MSALSAPSSPKEVHTLSTAILVVSVLSAIGAGWIILSFILFRPLRSFRHQLILGLAISDFWMAINFMSSAIVTIRGRDIGSEVEKPFCSFNGFMVQLFVAQTDYWVLAIAIYTYLILANHKHQSTWVQDHKLTIWVIPWFLSTLWASIGLAVVGYGDIGAWCWFVSDTVRLFVNFIPRWLIIIIMLALYTRLYFIIYKSHSRFMSFSEDAAESLPTSSVSASRNTPRLQFGVISNADKNGGRGGGGVQVTGRAPSVLKRVLVCNPPYLLLIIDVE
ncbi:hypothetical protein ACLOAV_004708 [Pseudogymnoascus australis]